jgi:flavin reductase (DIM6/NTAB) family NADH-FMN oxidoreductase RutF
MTMPLPEVLKQWLRPLPQWPPVALRAPQTAVRIRLVMAGGEFNVTGNAVVAALRPLTLAMGLDAQLLSAIAADPRPSLHFVDLESRRTVGMLQLRHQRNWHTSGTVIGLFEVRRGTQCCLPWPYRSWNRWLQNRRMRANTDPNNFFMAPEAIQQQMIFYICPRPVVLVSVDDGTHCNLFPMDLIGPLLAERFTLALRSTSPSITTMKNTRRVAVSDVPARDYAAAYKLGVHHKNVKVDWDRLPFAIRRSPEFSLPCPETTLRVRELQVLDFDTIGTHTLFVTRVASDVCGPDGTQFFHTSGIYQYFRSRHDRSFPPCN